MALEDLEVEPLFTDDAQLINLNEVMQDNATPDDVLVYNRDLSIYTDTLELADKALDVMETVNPEDGMSHLACEALIQAIECLLKPSTLRWSQPTFESMTTLRTKLRNRDVALEGLREIVTKVWDALLALLRRMRDWFMSFFKRNKLQTRVLEEKLDQATKKVAMMKEQRKHLKRDDIALIAYANEVEPHKARLSLTQKRHLMVGTHVPSGAKFIQHLHDFMAQANEFREGFAKFDHEVLRDLSEAVARIDDQNNAFQTAFGAAYEAVWMSPLSKHANKQPPLSKGVSLFMEPLAFGNMSFYRTAVTGSANPQATDAVAYVGTTPGFDEQEIGDASVEAMIEVQWETVLKLCGDEMKRMRAHEDEDHVGPMLDKLLRDMERLSKHAQTDKRTRSRAVQLHKLLGIYNTFRASGAQALLKYQKNVIDGALEYAVSSVH